MTGSGEHTPGKGSEFSGKTPSQFEDMVDDDDLSLAQVERITDFLTQQNLYNPDNQAIRNALQKAVAKRDTLSGPQRTAQRKEEDRNRHLFGEKRAIPPSDVKFPERYHVQKMNEVNEKFSQIVSDLMTNPVQKG
jgi:hypothetical protein